MNEIIKILNKMREQNIKYNKSVSFDGQGNTSIKNKSSMAWATRYYRQAKKLMEAKGMSQEEIIEMVTEHAYKINGEYIK